MRKVFLTGLAAVVLLAAAVYGVRALTIHKARQPILAMLSDPDSAMFRNETVVGPWFRYGVVCGEINVKNKMGGYVGYVDFHSVASVLSDETSLPMLTNTTPGADLKWVNWHCDDLRYLGVSWWWLQW